MQYKVTGLSGNPPFFMKTLGEQLRKVLFPVSHGVNSSTETLLILVLSWVSPMS